MQWPKQVCDLYTPTQRHIQILFVFTWTANFVVMALVYRSSLNEENDKATFGAFVAIDPSQETLSLRTLVSYNYT